MGRNGEIEEIKSALINWKNQKLEVARKKSRERKKDFTSESGSIVKEVYTPVDLKEKDFDYTKDLGFPGAYPFTRGVNPTMYRENFWVMMQNLGFGTPQETNQRYKYLFQQGITGLSMLPDLPTQIGYDSDHRMAHGEVGKLGVAIDSLKDMEIIFDGVPLNKFRQISTNCNALGPIIIGMYIALAEKQGFIPNECHFRIQNDPLKEFFARGAYIVPPEPALRMSVDVIEYCSKNLPNWIPITFSGYHIREAGANPIQEIAFTLADGISYIESALKRGLNIDDFAPKLSIYLNSNNEILEEVAKFRVTRRIWAKLLKERFGAKDEKSCAIRIVCQTGGSTLSAQQPMNNVIRVTIQALGAVLGGVPIHLYQFNG